MSRSPIFTCQTVGARTAVSKTAERGLADVAILDCPDQPLPDVEMDEVGASANWGMAVAPGRSGCWR